MESREPANETGLSNPSEQSSIIPASLNLIERPADKSSKSSSFKPKARQKKQDTLKAKQASRKFRGAYAPDPSLGITLDDFASFTEAIKSSKRIFALFGAGLSAPSGIATYRGADRFWRGVDPATFSDPQSFFEDPAQVWWLFTHRMLNAQTAKPNAAHIALAKLAQVRERFFAVNQNIDGLCERAGFPEEQIARVHGTLFNIKCSNYNSTKEPCDYNTKVSYPINEHLTIPRGVNISDPTVPLPTISRGDLPHCPKCNNLLRPDVVFFNESIPLLTTERIYNFTSSGPMDMVLVVGTSAVVLPAAMYILVARNAGARVAFFNLEETEEEPGRVCDGDWMFAGDAAVMVAEMLKGVVGKVADPSKKGITE